MGIYYVYGDKIPIQILVGKQLSEEENLWLRGLTNELRSREMVERLIEDYQEHKDNTLYQSAMNIIVQANQEQFKEGKNMVCNALMELFGDELKERMAEMEAEAEAKIEARRAELEARKAKMLKEFGL